MTANELGNFKIRLRKEPISDVLGEAEKLSSNRKSARAAKNKMTKNVAESLRVLTTFTRENRKRFMNRLPQNGAQKVVTNAVALNSERKNAIRKVESNKKIEAEKRRLEEEAQKRRNIEEARLKQVRDQKIKNVASTLQGLTSLERENRKRFMNRLATNGANKVLANAAVLNKQRKNASKRDPLLKRIERNVPRETNFAQARMKWTAAIKGAKDDNELTKIEKLLNDKLKLKARTESEVTNLPSKQKPQYLQNIMAYRNDLADRTQKLNQLVKTKRETKNKATKEIAQKLQSLTKLERTNRTLFMNRVARGENANKVLANADKLQRNRVAAEQDKKVLENKRRREEEEKAKRDKLRGDTAKMLQGMSGLERKNRREFMQRLERGNDPATVISNARARDATKGFSFNKKPPGQLKRMTTQQRFNTPKPASGVAAAKSEIYRMRGMGVKNQQSFVRRLEKGENASRVLRDARARAQKVGGQVSKTKKQLQYNAKVRNVVRRL